MTEGKIIGQVGLGSGIVGVVMPFVQQRAWAVVVFALSVAALGVGELSQAVKWRRAASPVDVRGEVVVRLAFFAAILVLPLSQSLAPDAVLGGPVTFVVGTGICWCGLLLRWWSIHALGVHFTVVVKTSADQVIIDRGPYRWLRHPSYTGLLTAFLGGGLMFGNWVGAIASFLLLLAGLLDRIVREEHAMIAAFGDAYLNFAEHRARLVPFLW